MWAQFKWHFFRVCNHTHAMPVPTSPKVTMVLGDVMVLSVVTIVTGRLVNNAISVTISENIKIINLEGNY